MSDQQSPDLSEIAALPNSDSKSSRWDFLKKLHVPWKKSPKIDQTPSETPNSSEPAIEDVPIEKKGSETTPRQTEIGNQLVRRLQEKGLVLEASEFERVGEPALEGTNERGSPVLFEKLRNQKEAPNGYLIGIGAGNVFSMLEGFPEGTVPKAVILFDIDPTVIEFGQYLIQVLRDSPDKLSSVIKKTPSENVFFPVSNANSEQAILKYADLLHQLAKEGNFVIARAEFNNPELIEELSALPDIQNLNNVIYLSNIADHLWRRTVTTDRNYVPNFNFLQALQPNPPHRNYYIDTLTFPLNYNLRVGTQPPNFKSMDFYQYRLANWQTEPTDLIDRDSEDVIWEDLSNWDLNRLLKANLALRSNPRFQEIAAYIEKEFNDRRRYEIERYPDLKQALAVPVEEREIYKDNQISIPETVEEEASLLAELAEPYSYERDFIPFIAHHIWQNATLPIEIDKDQIPKRKIIRDPNTGKRIWAQEPAEWTKGNIELWRIEGSLFYEDLAVAKIYRELERRLKDKNPTADTKGKTCQELSRDLVGVD